VAGDAVNLFEGCTAVDCLQKAIEEHGAESLFLSHPLKENRILALQNHLKEIVVQN
jgi:hypothetical protein